MRVIRKMSRIVLWIVIVFFMVSSTCLPPVFIENKNATCFRTTSHKEPRNTRGEINPLRSKEASSKFLENEKASTPLTEYVTVWQEEKICCPNYQDKDGTCTPECSITCENGHCAQPNICKCDNNWGGESCNDPLFCIVIQTISVSVSCTVSEIDDETENHLLEWKGLPKCLPECLDQVLPGNCTQHGNMTYHLYPIVEPCKGVAANWIFVQKYSYVIGGVTAIIILLVIVICIVVIVRRKRIPSIITNSEPMDPTYEYVDLKQINDGIAFYSKS